MVAALAGAGCQERATVSAKDLLHQARALQLAGDHAASIEILQELVRQVPRKMAARRLLIAAYLELGDGEAAESHIERAVRMGAEPAALRPMRLRALVLQGAYARAIAAMPEDELAAAGVDELLSLAQARSGLNQYAEAKALFESILARSPGDKTALTGLVELALRTGDLTSAARHLQGLPPEESGTRRLDGKLALLQGDAARAEGAFRGLAEEAPQDEEALLALAQARLAQDDHEGAREALERVLAVNAQSSDAHYLLGASAHLVGDLDESVRHLRESLGRTPQHGPALKLFGLASIKLGHPEQALESLKTYLSASPGDLEARKLLAAVLLQQEQPWEAAGVLEAAGDDDADPVLLTLRGLTEVKRGNYSAGIDLLERAVALPDVADAGADEPSAAAPFDGGSLTKRSTVDSLHRLMSDDRSEDEATSTALASRIASPDQANQGDYTELARRAEAQGDEAEACALYARLLREPGEEKGAARRRFEALGCEEKYGSISIQAARSPGKDGPRRELNPTHARVLRAGVMELLKATRVALRHEDTAPGLADATAASTLPALSGIIAKRLVSHQVNTVTTHRMVAGEPVRPLFILPPDIKERIKDLRDSLPPWVRRLDDAPRRGSASQTSPEEKGYTGSSTEVVVTVQGDESGGFFGALADLYGGFMDFLAALGDAVRNHQGWVVLLGLAVAAGALLSNQAGRGRAHRQSAPPEEQQGERVQPRRSPTSRRRGRGRSGRSRRRRRHTELQTL